MACVPSPGGAGPRDGAGVRPDGPHRRTGHPRRLRTDPRLHGPELVADGASSFHRVLTDPRDGAPLEIGRDSYRIPTAMRQWLSSGTANARSPAATTTPWTTKQTTSWPGPTAAPPASPTSVSCAPNTTGSNTPRPGHPPKPPKTNHPAGPHPPAATTKANTTTGNHPTGHHRYGSLLSDQRTQLQPCPKTACQKRV